MSIDNVSPNGIMTINFSEQLKSLLELINENKRMLIENFLEIIYVRQENGCTEVLPELIDWYIISFENT